MRSHREAAVFCSTARTVIDNFPASTMASGGSLLSTDIQPTSFPNTLKITLGCFLFTTWAHFILLNPEQDSARSCSCSGAPPPPSPSLLPSSSPPPLPTHTYILVTNLRGHHLAFNINHPETNS